MVEVVVAPPDGLLEQGMLTHDLIGNEVVGFMSCAGPFGEVLEETFAEFARDGNAVVGSIRAEANLTRFGIDVEWWAGFLWRRDGAR